MDGDNNMIIDNIGSIIRLTAADGKIITDNNGTEGKEIWLGAGRTAEEFVEIDEPIIDESGIEA